MILFILIYCCLIKLVCCKDAVNVVSSNWLKKNSFKLIDLEIDSNHLVDDDWHRSRGFIKDYRWWTFKGSQVQLPENATFKFSVNLTTNNPIAKLKVNEYNLIFQKTNDSVKVKSSLCPGDAHVVEKKWDRDLSWFHFSMKLNENGSNWVVSNESVSIEKNCFRKGRYNFTADNESNWRFQKYNIYKFEESGMFSISSVKKCVYLSLIRPNNEHCTFAINKVNQGYPKNIESLWLVHEICTDRSEVVFNMTKKNTSTICIWKFAKQYITTDEKINFDENTTTNTPASEYMDPSTKTPVILSTKIPMTSETSTTKPVIKPAIGNNYLVYLIVSLVLIVVFILVTVVLVKKFMNKRKTNRANSTCPIYEDIEYKSMPSGAQDYVKINEIYGELNDDKIVINDIYG